MHRRLWGSISRRPSKHSFVDQFLDWYELVANRYTGQNGKERAIPNGDSPEANVARGVVSIHNCPDALNVSNADTSTEAVLRIRRPQ